MHNAHVVMFYDDAMLLRRAALGIDVTAAAEYPPVGGTRFRICLRG
jgi:hypothetical protein